VYGFEGANVLFDSFVHPLMMGLEEHLLQMFRGDFEFHDEAAASHLPLARRPQGVMAKTASPDDAPKVQTDADAPRTSIETVSPALAPAASVMPASSESAPPRWTPEGEQELKKIPFFVRGKARRNTERFAHERGVSLISVETLYEAKAHFGR
jgi:light-independent protochlorophyllide reductase subunit B